MVLIEGLVALSPVIVVNLASYSTAVRSLKLIHVYRTVLVFFNSQHIFPRHPSEIDVTNQVL